jgi:PTS system sucrose-specific IIC component
MTIVDTLYAPITGQVFTICDVHNHIFSEKKMGEGFAVKPTGSTVVSPVTGTVKMINGYAVILESKFGLEILIHIGLDTVTLDGAPFISLVKVGDKVKPGDALVSVDWRKVDEKGLERTVIVAILNTEHHLNTVAVNYKQAYAGTKIGMAHIIEQAAGTKGLRTPENPNNNIKGADLAKENHFV